MKLVQLLYENQTEEAARSKSHLQNVVVLVTIASAGNAIGNRIHVPMKHKIPQGSVGSANGDGWIQKDNLSTFLNHFKTRARPSKENKFVLLLNNHSCYIVLKDIDFCKYSDVVLLRLPTHCAQKMQPQCGWTSNKPSMHAVTNK